MKVMILGTLILEKWLINYSHGNSIILHDANIEVIIIIFK